jgi:hypothetical protein
MQVDKWILQICLGRRRDDEPEPLPKAIGDRPYPMQEHGGAESRLRPEMGRPGTAARTRF